MCDVMVQSNSVHSGKVRMTSSIIIFSFLPSFPSSLLPFCLPGSSESARGGSLHEVFLFYFLIRLLLYFC